MSEDEKTTEDIDNTQKNSDFGDTGSKTYTGDNADSTNSEEQYSLYTEHIVPDNRKKIRKMLTKIAVVAICAVVFGLIAGLIMLLTIKVGRNVFEQDETTTRSPVVIDNTVPVVTTPPETDPTTSETTTPEEITLPSESPMQSETESVTEPPASDMTGESESTLWDADTEARLNDLSADLDVLKAIVNRSMTYSVTVTSSNDANVFNSTYQNYTESYGFIVVINDNNCYIVTKLSAVEDAQSIQVKFNNGITCAAEYVGGDATTGLAVIMTPIVNFAGVNVATLGSSFNLVKGDAIVAVGDLYGFGNSFGYGVITDTSNIVSDTDCSYKIISSDILVGSTPSGILVDSNCNIVGLITYNYSGNTTSFVRAYGISELRGLIENMSNGIVRPYLGIKGIASTNSGIGTSELPAGLYVTNVEQNSPAYTAGIQLGDIITSIGGIKVEDVESYMEVLSSLSPGMSVDVTIKRQGRTGYRDIVYGIKLTAETGDITEIR
mgnify:CR=1 FL=1